MNKAEQVAESVEGRDPAKGIRLVDGRDLHTVAGCPGDLSERRARGRNTCEGPAAPIDTILRAITPSPFVDTASSDPRQEPYEVVLHVRICAGGRP